MINEDIAQEIMHQLFSSLEALETQSMAILQLLKDKGIASDEELAGPFERAGNASSVKWRAARVRMDHLLSSALHAAQEDPSSQQPKAAENKQESQPRTSEPTSREKEIDASSNEKAEKKTQSEENAGPSGGSKLKEEQPGSAGAENDRNRQNDRSKSPEHAEKTDSDGKAPGRKSA